MRVSSFAPAAAASDYFRQLNQTPVYTDKIWFAIYYLYQNRYHTTAVTLFVCKQKIIKETEHVNGL